MQAVSCGGINVPFPIPSSSGALLHVIDGIQIDVLTWLTGATMDQALNGQIKRGDLEGTLDYGLIHADLMAANVIVDDNNIHFIDFGDGGFGFRLFDIATALLKHLDTSDYPTLRAALVKGYGSVRPIDLSALNLFMMLRAATYVGWNITRMNEDGARAP